MLGYIKYSGDKKQLHSFTENNPRMTMEADAVRVIRTVTNTPVEIQKEAEEVNMCKAIEEMMEDSRQEGRKEGQKEGRKEGEMSGALHILTGLVRDNILSIKEAARRANLSEAAFEAELKKM